MQMRRLRIACGPHEPHLLAHADGLPNDYLHLREVPKKHIHGRSLKALIQLNHHEIAVESSTRTVDLSLISACSHDHTGSGRQHRRTLCVDHLNPRMYGIGPVHT